jgi:antitoxin (DNA-binding transcriptional repressor) of toxin-antitoxin stability system
MPVYTVHEAETHLSALIERAERGEEVIIERGDKPALRLELAAAKKKPKRQPGAFAGQIVIHDSFYEPMSEEELALWEGGHDGDPLLQPPEKPGA